MWLCLRRADVLFSVSLPAFSRAFTVRMRVNYSEAPPGGAGLLSVQPRHPRRSGGTFNVKLLCLLNCVAHQSGADSDRVADAVCYLSPQRMSKSSALFL